MSVTTFAMSHVVKPTSQDERKLLQAAGFVHVTGLVATSFMNSSDTKPIGHDLHPRDLGRFGSNNSTDVVITTGGEVWLASHTDGSISLKSELINTVLTELCPNGIGAWVPCSNGEQLNYRDLLKRVADPDCDPR